MKAQAQKIIDFAKHNGMTNEQLNQLTPSDFDRLVKAYQDAQIKMLEEIKAELLITL